MARRRTERLIAMATMMRVTQIDLDESELPITITVRMTRDVWDRLCRDFRAMRSAAQRDYVPGLDAITRELWTDRFPTEWVAQTYQLYADAPATDPIAGEIYRCLSLLCNRFWPAGTIQALH